MENVFQTADDFSNRINKGIFTNLEKSYSPEELQAQFGDHQILTKANVAGYIQEVYKQTGGEIIKGKFNDTDEAKAIIKGAEHELSQLEVILLKGAENSVEEVFILKSKSVDNISKEVESDNPFLQKAKNNDLGGNLEKGKIYEAFRYSELLKFKKSGKDIIEKMTARVALIEANIERLAAAISVSVVDGNPPTEKMYQYGLSATILCPYLLYHYCLIDYWDGRNINEPCTTEARTQIYPSASSEECEPYRAYNRLVEEWFEEQKELQLIRLCESNFVDSDKYELTAEQMIALGF